MQPSISVVIPTYNRGAAIALTLDSALQQDFAPESVEIIVVDDGSTDDTFAFLREKYGKYPRVHLFSTTNGGVARARNFGLEKARGEFIAYLDHDDLWLPQKLTRQFDELSRHEKAGVVYCRWHEVNEADGNPQNAPIQKPSRKAMPTGKIFSSLMDHNFILSMTIPMIRTRYLREIGGFDPRFVPCDDWDIWLKLSQKCEFIFCEDILAIYVRHPSQQSSSLMKMSQAKNRLIMHHLKKNWRFALSNRKLSWRLLSLHYFAKSREPYYQKALTALTQKDWRGAWRSVGQGVAHFPLIFLTPQWLYLLLNLLRRNSKPF